MSIATLRPRGSYFHPCEAACEGMDQNIFLKILEEDKATQREVLARLDGEIDEDEQ